MAKEVTADGGMSIRLRSVTGTRFYLERLGLEWLGREKA
jgi:hypothetical protein